ncbi:hypothetical protein [Nesterenkonia natronophila]|uniref:Leucine rich repeat variant domain-containing protein n=1 Tax=Nesterenkonia natronophila TaxID=2174932 RepID=A0A3A4FDY1_9MICC|nr:hypothetical protein [Nesterenkonia natronophila]RJN33004.1 hypothetical protein D3250_04145 [Nesterenkonia natronophila]
MTKNHDLEALASNPHTDWDVLHWIAENHPELRPVIAANPGAYQELIDALGALKNPEIDAAIAQREAAGGVTGAPEPVAESAPDPDMGPGPTSPMDGLWDTTGYTLAAQQAAAATPPHPEPEPIPEAQTQPAQEPVQPAESEDFAEPAPAAAPAPEPPPVAVPAEASQPAAAPETEPVPERRRRATPIYPIAAAVVGILGVGALIGLLVLLFGGDDDEDVVAESPAPTSPADEEDEEADDAEEPDAEETSEEDSTEDDEAEAEQEAIEEARSAVAGLPEGSSCEADSDASVVAAFLSVAADEDWADEDDPEMLESTFDSLQSECSTTHAASVFESARSGSQAPDEGHGEMLTSVGTDWVDREVGLRGAEQMSGFSAQDGNVECDFDDGVTCTVYQTSPALCEEGTTYTMTVDGVDVDCDAQLDRGGRDTLSVDSSATDGFLVCTEMSDRVSCYNSIDPFGFEMSNTGNYAY